MGIYEIVLLLFVASGVALSRWRHKRSKDRGGAPATVRDDWVQWMASGSMCILVAIELFRDSGRVSNLYGYFFIGWAVYSFLKALQDAQSTRAQFSIRSVMLLTAVIALYCGIIQWLGVLREHAIFIGVLWIGVFIFGRRWYIHRQTITNSSPSKIQNLKSEI
jgi:hypothetical protein